MPTGERTVIAGDVALFVKHVGGRDRGPVLLAINGGPGFSHEYMSALARLASPDVRVVFFDQRGTGRSTAPDTATFRAQDYVGDIEAIRNALGVDSMHVLGHSWGGGLALMYSAALPERVASLTLIDNLPPSAAGFQAGAARFQAHVGELITLGLVPNRIPPPVGDDCTPMVLATLPAYFGDPRFAVPAEIAAGRCSQRVLQTTYGAVLATGFDFAPALRTFARPTHVLFGEADAYGLAWQQETVTALTHAAPTVTTIHGAGHYPWMDRPSDSFRALRAFYADRAYLAVGP